MANQFIQEKNLISIYHNCKPHLKPSSQNLSPVKPISQNKLFCSLGRKVIAI